MEFNKRFKDYLKNKGVTAKEVGILLGYSEAMMSRYANAEKPNIEFIDRLVAYDPEIDLNEMLKEDVQLSIVAKKAEEYNKKSVELLREVNIRISSFLNEMPQK